MILSFLKIFKLERKCVVKILTRVRTHCVQINDLNDFVNHFDDLVTFSHPNAFLNRIQTFAVFINWF